LTEVAVRYFSLGFSHILPKGLDHILFVVGLFLLSTRWRSVLLQVSTFTLAHSITLGLTIDGIVSLPARVVEPMIALSIAYVAIENLVTTELKTWRLALVFSFGLLHGMGFASVLRDLGLPRSNFLAALVTSAGKVIRYPDVPSAAVKTMRGRFGGTVVSPLIWVPFGA